MQYLPWPYLLITLENKLEYFTKEVEALIVIESKC